MSTTEITKPAVGSTITLRTSILSDGVLNYVVVDPTDYTDLSGREIAEDGGESLVLVERVSGWEGKRKSDGAFVRLWWLNPESIASVETASVPAAPTTVTLEGAEYPVGSLLGEAAAHALALPEGGSSRDILTRVIGSLRTVEADRDRLQGAFDDRNATIMALRDEQEAFQTKVRDLIIAKAESGSICHDGANRALEALGLPRMARAYEVEIEVRQYVTVTIDEATDEDDAREQAESNYEIGDLLDLADRYSWDTSVESVREQ